ncbi:MAG: segregation and condensation protein A [Gammaproteobacteria bacterium]|nr:segregation and condensation protein A [Gammaproteobacteria bacterium]
MSKSKADQPIEFRVLQAMKSTLTSVIKDTTVEPGMRHPLSDSTIENIRHCLLLITTRERELIEEAGDTMNMRPHYTDEPQTSTVVPITKIGRRKDNDD